MMSTRCNKEITETVANLIRAGTSKRFAAQAAGISRQCFYDWLRKGEAVDAEEPHRSFASAIRKAEGEQVGKVSGVIMGSILDGDGHLGLKYLKMYYPKDFGDQPPNQGDEVAPLQPLDLAASFASAVQGEESDDN